MNCDSGEIILDDKNITSLPMYKRASNGLGYFHNKDQSLEVYLLKIIYFSNIRNKKIFKRKRETILEELLTEFSLTHLRSAFPSMLSGGEVQKM